MLTIIIYSILGIFALIFALIIIFGSFFTVKQKTAAVIERFGKFLRIAKPGLNIKVPLIDRVAGRPSLRVQQLNVPIDTKTKDNVFVNVKVSVQYMIPGFEKVEDAFYKLTDVGAQINSYVFDTVRAQVPKINLDDVFEKKDEIADSVKKELSETMKDFGFEIVKALVTDIEPAQNVREAMNEINAAQRLRVAANEKGEAEKILKVKNAEAEAMSKKLQGEGIANQRKAIIDGLKISVKDFKESVEGSSSQDVMNLVMMTQFFDTLKEIGADAKSKVIFMPSTPGAIADFTLQIRNAMISAQEAAKDDKTEITKKTGTVKEG